MSTSTGVRLTGPRAILVGMVIAAASAARGGVMTPGPEGLSIFAGGRVNVLGFSSIEGNVGAGDSVWLGSASDVTGDLYTLGSLSTGISVDITGSLVVSGSTYIGGWSTVNGGIQSVGDFGTSSSITITGDVVTEGQLDLGKKSTIYGRGQYGTGYSLGSEASVQGGLSEIIDSIDVWSPGDLGGLTLLPAGSENIVKAQDSVSALAPGAYGSLSTGRDVTINLVAGSYSFNAIDLDKSTVLNVDTSAGDVVIHVQQGLTADNSFHVNTTGPGGVSFIVGGDIELGISADIDASLVSLTSNITLDGMTTVAGQLWAQGDIDLGFNTNVGGASFVTIPLAGGATIPEPATVVMIGAGLSLMARRKACGVRR
ncbi:MAG: PEP-CTERM sorting domain-containing protein [Phycisphaeraceae bacterium]|nr:PEP-CTERM sorting domain-containing protein [Phycisphaeraceae bacterium]